jgi:asparaginyl-tRNA synthetase
MMTRQDNGFVLVQPPILTSNDCEGAGEAFRVTTDGIINQVRAVSPKTGGDATSVPSSVPEFFGKPTYLTVSTQLHLEALAASISRVYSISPVFRAEPSQTHRHVSEFFMVEAELSFCEELEDVMSFVEQSLKEIVYSLRTSAAPEFSVFRDMQFKYGGHPLEDASSRPTLARPIRPVDLTELHTSISSRTKVWARMTYLEAVKELESYITLNPGRQIFSHPVGLGLSLQSEHEKWLAGTLVRGPVFVTDYPATLKPFYMRSNGSSVSVSGEPVPQLRCEKHKTVSCFDLLVPRVGELVGGSLREERIDLLVNAMEQQNIPRESMEWYLDLRQYGGAPTGGFGLGFERLMSWLTGFENVRDCMPFPRAAGKILL